MKDISIEKLPVLRHGIQTCYFLFCLWTGYRFFQFLEWASGKSELFTPKPPAVEAFLPISALVGLKHWIYTHTYDPVHPAGLTVFLAIVVSAFFWRKGFCGWICPVGAISNLVEKAGRRLGFLYRLPAWLDIPLLSIKYLLLGFFLYFILWKMDSNQIQNFITSPYNVTVDARMLEFFLSPSNISLLVMLSLLVISLFLRNFWCRYLCPYGALLGILATAGPVQIKRDGDKCVDCGKCERACPSSIKITHTETVRRVECIGCLECVKSCPVENCIAPHGFGKRLALFLIPAQTMAILLVFYAAAVVTGHWQSQIPPEVLKSFYKLMQLH